MHNVEWKPELSVGIKNVDDDHKRLIELTNTLINAIDEDMPREELITIFEELESYTHYHFEREEGFMNEHCSAGNLHKMIDKHKAQHRYFTDKLPELKEQLMHANSKSVSYEIVEFLLQWLLDHIINEDLKLTQCLEGDQHNGRSLVQRIGDSLRRKTTLHQRLWFILALPLFFFIIQTLFISYNAYDKYHQLQDVEKITQSVININNIITQLQKERGLSSAYISSNYQHFRKELLEQRRKTDEVLRQSIHTRDTLRPYINVDRSIATLNRLARIRADIDTKRTGQQDILAYYSDFVNILIGIIKDISYLPFNSIDQNTYASVLLLLHLNEVHGLIRKEGVTCLEKRRPSCQHLKKLLKKENAYLDSFLLLASHNLTDEVNKIETSDNTHRIKTVQTRIITEDRHGKELAQEWFNITSLRIEAYKEIIEQTLKEMKDNACLQKNHFSDIIDTVWIIFILIVLFIGISIYLFKESILYPLGILTNAMHKLSVGDKSVHLSTVNKKDAIGKMEQAYNHLRRSLIKADYASILMELQELKTQKYARLSEEDALTGIANRRAFMQRLKYEMIQSNKEHKPLTLLILDLDHFKQVNDTYGHTIGDLLLQHFVEHTKELIRSSDIFARIGGEEFALLLPSTSREEACFLAKNIVKNISSLDFGNLAPGLHMTVSIGVSEFKKGLEIKEFIKDADNNLYKAKHQGRNQVYC